MGAARLHNTSLGGTRTQRGDESVTGAGRFGVDKINYCTSQSAVVLFCGVSPNCLGCLLLRKHLAASGIFQDSIQRRDLIANLQVRRPL